MPSQDYEQDTSTRFGPLRIKARGRAVMSNPTTNRGTAFTIEERKALGLIGLVPSQVTNLENQVRRVYEQYTRTSTRLGKYLHLSGVRDRNEVLFYRLLTSNLEEMLPIVYTPTIGEAIERFSHEFSRPRGVFLSIDHPESMAVAFRNFGLGPDEVDLVVVTDSEGILGIGDQGIGGIQIAVGKLSVYTAAAGIHPRRAIPVVLDVGTDNLGLLSSEMYLGERHARVRGEKYDEFLDLFVHTVREMFPNAMLHWEDFGTTNAHRMLTKYRDEICTFNDDIQGTAAVVLAAILAAVDVTGLVLDDHKVCVFGAGSAGVGINGLYVDDQPELLPFQRPYARRRAEVEHWAVADPNHITLEDVIRNAKPTILIGTSTRGGAFSRHIVEEMASYCARPIIFPLSNPTSRAEATPADLLTWTDGRALVATGSPFGPVDYDGIRYQIAQANNALIFPGLGLGVATCRAERVTEGMIAAAAEALASMVNAYRQGAPLLPTMSDLRMVSATVAVAVAKQAEREGLAREPLTDPIQQIYNRMWQPVYPPVEAI